MSYPPPTYLADSGQISATLRRADAPPDLERPGGGAVRYLADEALTLGAYGLFGWEMGPGPGGASPHFHRGMAESFYVLDGAVELYDGSAWHPGGRGDFLHVPAGGIHAFRNTSGAPASMLILFVPGAPREAYFEELVAIATEGRQLSEQEWAELYARHDQVMV